MQTYRIVNPMVLSALILSCYGFLMSISEVIYDQMKTLGNSLTVQRLEFQSFTAGGMGSIPGWGIQIPHAMGCDNNNKKP